MLLCMFVKCVSLKSLVDEKTFFIPVIDVNVQQGICRTSKNIRFCQRLVCCNFWKLNIWSIPYSLALYFPILCELQIPILLFKIWLSYLMIGLNLSVQKPIFYDWRVTVNRPCELVTGLPSSFWFRSKYCWRRSSVNFNVFSVR